MQLHLFYGHQSFPSSTSRKITKLVLSSQSCASLANVVVCNSRVTHQIRDMRDKPLGIHGCFQHLPNVYAMYCTVYMYLYILRVHFLFLKGEHYFVYVTIEVMYIHSSRSLVSKSMQSFYCKVKGFNHAVVCKILQLLHVFFQTSSHPSLPTYCIASPSCLLSASFLPFLIFLPTSSLNIFLFIKNMIPRGED